MPGFPLLDRRLFVNVTPGGLAAVRQPEAATRFETCLGSDSTGFYPSAPVIHIIVAVISLTIAYISQLELTKPVVSQFEENGSCCLPILSKETPWGRFRRAVRIVLSVPKDSIRDEPEPSEQESGTEHRPHWEPKSFNFSLPVHPLPVESSS